MTTNENLQQAYMMLLNTKHYLRKVQKEWVLKYGEMEDLCEKISSIQYRIYELIYYFDDKEEE